MDISPIPFKGGFAEKDIPPTLFKGKMEAH